MNEMSGISITTLMKCMEDGTPVQLIGHTENPWFVNEVESFPVGFVEFIPIRDYMDVPLTMSGNLADIAQLVTVDDSG